MFYSREMEILGDTGREVKVCDVGFGHCSELLEQLGIPELVVIRIEVLIEIDVFVLKDLLFELLEFGLSLQFRFVKLNLSRPPQGEYFLQHFLPLGH